MTKSTNENYIPNPISKDFEFGGPIGALGVTLSVPFFTYWLAFACNDQFCPPWPLNSFLSFHSLGFESMKNLNWWKSLISLEGLIVYSIWYLFTILCWAFLPGKLVEGGEMRNGKKLTYKMNGKFFIFQFILIQIENKNK